MKVVYKYALDVADLQVLELPVGAKILTVQVQHNGPCLWALVDQEAKTEQVGIRIAGTGHPIDDNMGEYIGTFQMHAGDIVFHAFNVKLESTP